jgi:hypothetical protein
LDFLLGFSTLVLICKMWATISPVQSWPRWTNSDFPINGNAVTLARG